MLQELPLIRRARGYRLYDAKGRRYLDLYLSGGRALLGHRPERTLLELKNLLSRGLAGDLPSFFERRLARALGGLLPDHSTVRVFANEERLVSAFSCLVGPSARIQDPVVDGPPAAVRRGAAPRSKTAGSFADRGHAPASSGRLHLRRWRPFLKEETRGDEPSILLPLLPFPGAFAPAVACIRGIPERELPPSEVVSPALLGALVRIAYDLRALDGYDEGVWSRFDAPWWERRGPYLIARCEKREYSALFRRLLEKGVLISPHYPGPSIVPAEHSPGELDPLRRLAQEWSGR